MFDLHGYGHLLIQGTMMTIKAGLISLVIGLIFGLIGAFCKLSSVAVLRYWATAYTTVVRAIPELLFVFFIFFGGSVLLQALLKLVGYNKYVEVAPFWAGVFALSTMFGAYATEVFRMALQAIPKGQTEAAQSIGMRPAQTFFRIILPQLWAVALPGLGNLTLVLLKDTALLSTIGVAELMYYAGRAGQTTQLPFTFFMAAALIYLALTTVIMSVIAWGEYLANPAKRYAKHLKKQAKSSQGAV